MREADEQAVWFTDQLNTARRPVRVVQINWLCPQDGCAGMMLATGGMWLTNPAGVHHRCNVCGFKAAIRDDKYPKIEYEPMTNA